MRNYSISTRNDYLQNFPFVTMREEQVHVLNEICEAFNSGYKYILLEAPTGFGKSPVAIAVAMTLGSSYICTSTKNLQTQYAKDFPFVKIAKGMNNFSCLVKDDFIRNNVYKCGLCHPDSFKGSNTCHHTTVENGPCLMHDNEIAENGCKYKTDVDDYEVVNRGTKGEEVFIGDNAMQMYQHEYLKWFHIKKLNENRAEWMPCEYYHRLNIARNSSHAIFNYAMFLSLDSKKIRPKQLLILDEGHLLETEILKFCEFSVSKRYWKRYISNFHMIDYGYDDIEKWIGFLIEVEAKMLASIGHKSKIKDLALMRKQNYNWNSIRIIKSKPKAANKNITDFLEQMSLENSKEDYVNNTELEFQLDDRITVLTNKIIDSEDLSNEAKSQAERDTDTLTHKIDTMLSNLNNWIVYDIKHDEFGEVERIEFKPLDISCYCESVFHKCSKLLIMSATILNHDVYCKSVGLNPADVKFIRVSSDFPIKNRPIYPLNIAYLNYESMQIQDVRSNIIKAIDEIMNVHHNDKGIIHTISYKQLNLIKQNISDQNAQRLVETNSLTQRDAVIAHHAMTKSEPTVLISPSLYTGLDLKDGLSRFQIIVKVPFPDLTDKWICAKTKKDKQWYYWQTALRLVQSYGRSIRSKDDWAKTYVLDSSFGNFLKKNQNMFPDWFTSAIVCNGATYKS
jgi:ATP-dependent DNA helicase DinG